ncbi:MAG: LysM peptidoglycan-binding domain-containing protein [Anaerolineaceae bacterium]|nr:LysM peptidoglycan-binding domain-containing protein [Anaerolineaceae bacterium]
MNPHRLAVFAILLISLVWLAGCAADPVLTPLQTATAGEMPPQTTLKPYATITPSATATPLPPGTATPLPSPTATPRTHVVALNETFGSIALRYGITIEMVQNANPDVDPYVLKVGQTLIIPAGAPMPTEQYPTPTPVAVTLSEVQCAPDSEGGLWCFLSARNQQAIDLESISALVRLGGKGSSETTTRMAYAPLNLLKSGERMPLGVYFNVDELNALPFGAPYSASAELTSALPLSPGSSRYLPLELSNQVTDPRADGLSAEVSGDLSLAPTEGDPVPAQTIWAAAAAYDAQDRLIGFRRWENQSALNPGETLFFRLRVYSIDQRRIDRVEILYEAMP